MDKPGIEYPIPIPNTNIFLLHNKDLSSAHQLSHIEMITIESVSYTSLKDLMSTSSPPLVNSPTHDSSWHEIPIKHPLVKQAALAYLQPMSSPQGSGEKGLFEKLKERCCGECGCVSWLYDVVLRNVKETFWERREEDFNDDYYDDKS